eukprot:GILI01007699.1.p1 GENE.GILI01007699.1~~GILI01007699.1.p1  ORF type:complete len:506 (-),score=153.71 GILI01007699.1:236-1753(-)
MKAEGKMAFDSELGRMSEHVLVLMMRCMGYAIKAQEVHEFAEHNTQFAVQLLLAVLLKEPPYEFELRCNCISGLLGFTTPQAFFSAADSKAIDFHECTGFTAKVDFTLNLMLRLSALQVLNDVITTQMYDHATIQAKEGRAVVNTMRCVMNIFQFSSQASTQWRQHVLLSTTFIDGATILLIQGHLKVLETLLQVNVVNVPIDVIRDLGIALKFMGFATYHMGQHGRAIRPMCSFIYNLLTLPIHRLMGNGAATGALRPMYVSFLQFLSNIDALAGDDVVEDSEDLIPELTSAEIRSAVHKFLANEVLGFAGHAELAAWHKRFTTSDPNTLVAEDSKTYQEIDAMFKTLLSQPKAEPTAVAPAATASAATVIADMPTLAKKSADTTAKKKKKKADTSKAAEAVTHVATGAPVLPKAASGNAAKFVCALGGNTMKVPVTSPYGHTYEKDAIEQWIATKGQVCPITGKPLKVSDLQPNKALQNEIMQEVIRESMTSAATQENDMYDF